MFVIWKHFRVVCLLYGENTHENDDDEGNINVYKAFWATSCLNVSTFDDTLLVGCILDDRFSAVVTNIRNMKVIFAIFCYNSAKRCVGMKL